jgi:hypothetical protein
MQKTILTLLAIILIQLLSSCTTNVDPNSSPTVVPPTAADIAGKWESEHGFFIIFDDQSRGFRHFDGTFSGSYVEEAADSELGILGAFSLADNHLRLVENDDSESCPGVEGLFEAAMPGDDKLHLTIIEDDCIYRVEGLFRIGQGGYPLLKFQRLQE